MSQFTEFLAKIRSKNKAGGSNFFLIESDEIGFGFNPVTRYAPGSLSVYQQNFYMRNTRMAGYNPGALPTDKTFWIPANPGRDLGHYADQAALDAAHPTPQQGALATVAPNIIVLRAAGNWNPISGGGSPSQLFFNFFSDLDTTSAEITCKGKKEFEAAFYSSKLSGISFLPKLNLATYPATPITTLVSLNQWIADNVASDTTLWQLKIVATYATNQTGEASATLIEKSSSSSQGQGTGNTSSQVGGTPATSGTGWAQYKDSQYTSVAPFRLTAGIDTVLPNNASDKIETQLPAGVVSLYNAANQKITPAASGDAYSLQVSFQAVPTIAGITLDFAIDINGAFGKIFKHRVRLGDAGQFEPVNISISALYSLDTFVANGGQIKITASQDVDVHSVGYIITRTHKAK